MNWCRKDALTHNLSLYKTYVTEALSTVTIHELYILGYFEQAGGAGKPLVITVVTVQTQKKLILNKVVESES